MAKIIDIRGTHGSGKSSIVHHLLKTNQAEDIVENGKPIGHHVPSAGLAVVGRYERVCGGCDGIKTADEVVRRVRMFASTYRMVMLEGILVAHTFSRYNALAEELTQLGHSYLFCFLNTPLGRCINRVERRRAEQGNEKPLNPENIIRDWHRIWERLRHELRQAGRRTLVLPWQDPFSVLNEELQ